MKRRHVEQGWQGASGLALFARSQVEIRGTTDALWLDGDCVQQAKVTQEKLRGGLEAIGGEMCFLEYATFAIGWHGFRISSWLLGLADPSGESSGQQGGSADECDGGVEDIEVLCHDESFQASGSDGCQFERHCNLCWGQSARAKPGDVSICYSRE